MPRGENPFMEGRRAGEEGKPISANPYRKTRLRRKWETGWFNAPPPEDKRPLRPGERLLPRIKGLYRVELTDGEVAYLDEFLARQTSPIAVSISAKLHSISE